MVDPLELIAAWKCCRRADMVLLGAAHSHPRGVPHPSAMDQRHAWPGSLVWISAVASRDSRLSEGNRGAWWVDGSGCLQPMTIKMERGIPA